MNAVTTYFNLSGKPNTKSVVKFYVDKEKGVVVCKKYCDPYEITQFMLDKLGLLPTKICPTISYNSLLMKSVYVGKAKLHPDDVFDEKTGKDLAYTRMMKKYHKDRCRRLDILSSVIAEKANIVDTIHKNCLDKMSKCFIDLQIENYTDNELCFTFDADVDSKKFMKLTK